MLGHISAAKLYIKQSDRLHLDATKELVWLSTEASENKRSPELLASVREESTHELTVTATLSCSKARAKMA